MLAVPDAKGAKRLHQARLLALIVPAGLLGGALFSQYVGGLYPCEMCYWQRWPHGAAILLALGAIASPVEAPRAPILTLLAAVAVAISGAIGVFHAGVELRWWEGVTRCTMAGSGFAGSSCTPTARSARAGRHCSRRTATRPITPGCS